MFFSAALIFERIFLDAGIAFRFENRMVA